MACEAIMTLFVPRAVLLATALLGGGALLTSTSSVWGAPRSGRSSSGSRSSSSSGDSSSGRVSRSSPSTSSRPSAPSRPIAPSRPSTPSRPPTAPPRSSNTTRPSNSPRPSNPPRSMTRPGTPPHPVGSSSPPTSTNRPYGSRRRRPIGANTSNRLGSPYIYIPTTHSSRHTFTGQVDKVLSAQSFKMLTKQGICTVYTNVSLPSGLSSGDVVRVTGNHRGSDVRNSMVTLLRNR